MPTSGRSEDVRPMKSTGAKPSTLLMSLLNPPKRKKK